MAKPPPNTHWIFYRHFGLDLRTVGDQFATTCPFCLKTGHFFISSKTGLYNCQRCGKEGNHFTFIQDLHADCLKSTSQGNYAALAANRGLQVSTLKAAELAKSHLNGAWLIPSKNEQGKIVNLYQAISTNDEQKSSPPLPRNPPRQQGTNRLGHYPPKRPPSNGVPGRPSSNGTKAKYEIKSSPTPCQQQLYGIELIDKQPRLIICEGHWDRLALWETFAYLTPIKSDISGCFEYEFHTKHLPDYSGPIFAEIGIVAVPGANQFKPQWAKLLRDRHVILIYDNDPDKVICPTCRGKDEYKAHPKDKPCPLCGGTKITGQVINPGRDGLQKVVKELDELGILPKSLLKVEWQANDPKDIRDVLLL